MTFLLDANLSPLIGTYLTAAGHYAVHVRDVGLRHSPDEEILDYAGESDFVVVSQDSDFTNLLFHRKAKGPSLLLLRNVQEVTAATIASLIVNNLEQMDDALMAGAVVSLYEDRLRIRRLPID
jgi:predicted nuclease of predicted toxin-antitoxin system